MTARCNERGLSYVESLALALTVLLTATLVALAVGGAVSDSTERARPSDPATLFATTREDSPSAKPPERITHDTTLETTPKG